MEKSMKNLVNTMEFIVTFFVSMGEDEKLYVVLDKENLPFVDIWVLKNMFSQYSGINLRGLSSCCQRINFCSTEMQTTAGYSGHSIVITSGDISNRARSVSICFSIHKRWSRYIADLNNVNPVKCLHESVK
ncbi:hypothetical protein VAE151_560160 [Vibrio aestuarianus]|uniref:Uncharacterized protein n=1 Tax=Vibrio aestuarianus TaxID=28171 RepID=A0ABM9FR78_9VIBR|nr:hypothetical protein [Vibrio aestuarianus]MDE1256980.1 hypothetical protein [Vibrio aestuarianus]MDE1306473.1 hypothetical protein [Vibrio aestuarianus]MDH5958985.1 hypothetical protein [Vibrio aestuarianus]MDH5989794.1 hypothetical protein [Vibrio aestuarianus]NKZ46158.1 hypothetical protein [Vibrio aestuarianus subsp. francensis]